MPTCLRNAGGSAMGDRDRSDRLYVEATPPNVVQESPKSERSNGELRSNGERETRSNGEMRSNPGDRGERSGRAAKSNGVIRSNGATAKDSQVRRDRKGNIISKGTGYRLQWGDQVLGKDKLAEIHEVPDIYHTSAGTGCCVIA